MDEEAEKLKKEKEKLAEIRARREKAKIEKE